MSINEVSLVLAQRYLLVLESNSMVDLPAPDGTSNAHLAWMCNVLLEQPNWPDDKFSRWLGFIQGVMASRGYISVNDERDFSRPLFHAVYKSLGVTLP
jgi:hypothetical protein